MKILCWLIDHEWAFNGAGMRCTRCHAMPYDDTTLPEWVRNTRIVPRLQRIAKRVKVWWRSRPCWFEDHKWSGYSDRCERCKQSGVDVAESGEWTLPVWRVLWKDYLRDRFGVVKPSLKDQKVYAVFLWNMRLGVERSTIYIEGAKYMTRYIAYLGPLCARLHHFFRGDDDRASHTHPWPFVTFPLATYRERRFKEGVEIPGPHYVDAFRFHYRPSTHEHIVVGRVKLFEHTPGIIAWAHDPRPFWTIVLTGPKTDEWGFYPKPGEFVHWREYRSDKRNLK